MKDFFTFYTDIRGMAMPFNAFSLAHVTYVFLAIVCIAILYRVYTSLSSLKKEKFLVGMGIYFLVEELIYTIWLLLFCRDNTLKQVMPLELCSLCVYMNVITIYLKKDYLRFFSGSVGTLAGIVAIMYPANIDGLYPVFAYRTINFYCLHASFILFGLIQLKDTSLLNYCYMKKNLLIVSLMFTVAFFINLVFKTEYMFVGIPPQIGIIAALYQKTGIVLFLPAIILALALIQVLFLFITRKIYRVKTL